MAQLKSDTVVQVADALAQSIKSQSAALQADASATAGAEIDLSAMGSALKAVQALFSDVLVVAIHDDVQIAGPPARVQQSWLRVVPLAMNICHDLTHTW